MKDAWQHQYSDGVFSPDSVNGCLILSERVESEQSAVWSELNPMLLQTRCMNMKRRERNR